MKKTISLLLALVLCLSLCACGESKTASNSYVPKATTPQATTPETTQPEATTPPVVKAKVGDSVKVSMFTCNLKRAEFVGEVCSVMNENYLLPCEHKHTNNPHAAKSGYQLLSFTFELTGYTGTSAFEFWLGNRKSMDFLVKYDENYEFGAFAIVGGVDPTPYSGWYTASKLDADDAMSNLSSDAFKFAPLENSIHEFRVYMEVPNQVAENTDKVDLIITLCEEDIVLSLR